VVALACSKCGRVTRLYKSAIVLRLAKGHTACQVCGAALEVPPDVLEEASGRVMTGVKPDRAKCPCCDQSVPNEPKPGALLVACPNCNARFFPVARVGDEPMLGPAGSGAPATPEHVAAAVAALPDDPTVNVVKAALVARAARGEVRVGEAEGLADSIMRLWAWKPSPRDCILPLREEEAEDVVPRVLFRRSRFHVDRKTNRPEILIAVSSEQVPKVIFSQDAATRGAGWLTSQLVGEDEKDTRDVAQDVGYRIRIRLYQHPQGVRLQFALQRNADKPEVFSEGADMEMARLIRASRVPLSKYFALSAIMGRLVRGTPLYRASPAAIARRLQLLVPALGPHADAFAKQLRLA
jgi:hypothetical protein